MNNSNLAGLNSEGLAKTLTYLQTELNRAGHYADIKNLVEGKFLIEELKTRREYVRGLYSCIEPDSDHAQILLSSIQAYERECDEWLRRITSGEQQVEVIEKQIKDLMQMVNNKREREKRAVSFLPSRIKQESRHGGME